MEDSHSYPDWEVLNQWQRFAFSFCTIIPSLFSLYAVISWPYKALRCHFKSVGLSEQQKRLKLKRDLLFEYKVRAVKLFSDYKNIVYAVFG